MTKQPRGDSSERSSSGPQIPTRKITDADVQRVAAAGEIPEEQLPELERWLRHAVNLYDQLARMYESCLTKKQKRKSIEPISVAAQRLSRLLKQPWVHGYMVSHEMLSLLSRKEDLSSNGSAAIAEQVERDLSGVEALVNRSAAMLKQLELRPENADEKIAAAPRANPAIKHLHNLMRFYWMRIGREPTFAEQSPYVKFVRAVYGIVGLGDEAEFETIRSRHTAALG